MYVICNLVQYALFIHVGSEIFRALPFSDYLLVIKRYNSVIPAYLGCFFLAYVTRLIVFQSDTLVWRIARGKASQCCLKSSYNDGGPVTHARRQDGAVRVTCTISLAFHRKQLTTSNDNVVLWRGNFRRRWCSEKVKDSMMGYHPPAARCAL